MTDNSDEPLTLTIWVTPFKWPKMPPTDFEQWPPVQPRQKLTTKDVLKAFGATQRKPRKGRA